MSPLFEPPQHHPLGQLFDSKAPFVVDPYQRDYAWTFRPDPDDESDEGEVADFIYDLKRLVDSVRKDPNASPYFFGLIVAAEQPNPGWVKDVKHEIVDGQQRLTTFALLSSAMIHVADAIRLEAQEQGDQRTARQCRNLRNLLTGRCIETSLASTTGEDSKPFDVLTLTEGDDRFFQKLVRDKPSGDSSARGSLELLLNAKTALVNAVEEWVGSGTSAERARALADCQSAIFDKVEVILIIAKNTVDAYRLFTVANNRGKPLEQADLLRAYLLQLVSPSTDVTVPRDVVEAWNDVDKREPERTNAALRAYYGSVVGLRAPKVDVFDAFARDIFKHSEYAVLNKKAALEVKNKVEEIRDAADLYDMLASGEWPYVAESRTVSDWDRDLLRRVVLTLKSARAIPLLLAAADEWVDESMFAILMRFVERAEFRFLVSNAHQSTVADRYFEAASRVRGGDGPDAIAEFLEPWVALLADDQAFKTGLEAMNYMRGAGRIRHLLAMLDDFFPAWKRHGTGASPDWRNGLRKWNLRSADIDHIYPRSQLRDASMNEVKHRLGNLTLLLDKDNRKEAKTLLPTSRRKMRIYETSRVALTEELAKTLVKKKRWDASLVEARHKYLVRMAEFVYQLSPTAKKKAQALQGR